MEVPFVEFSTCPSVPETFTEIQLILKLSTTIPMIKFFSIFDFLDDDKDTQSERKDNIFTYFTFQIYILNLIIYICKKLRVKKIISFYLFLGIFLNTNGQVLDSLHGSNRIKFDKAALYVPVTLLVGGIALNSNTPNSLKNQVKDWRNKEIPNFRTHFDNLLLFAPFAAVYGFELMGMTPKTDFKNRTAIIVKSEVINLGLVTILKTATNQTRPDGTRFSFPSGHTAMAFSGATLLSMEYGERYQWVPYVAYTTASAVGVLRIANNKHYLSDVLFGAGLGILSVKIAYWTHQYKWNKNTTTNAKDPFDGIIYGKQY